MNPTTEQQTIIASAKERKNLAIQAYAGAAKTTTCVMIAENVIKPSLYIAFNKDIAEEAKGKFPTHVTCQTIHSLAYKAIVKFPKSKMGNKLVSSLQLSDIEVYLQENKDFDDEEFRFEFKLTVRELVTLFCQSDSGNLEEFVRTYLDSCDVEETMYEQYVYICKLYWKDLTNENSSTKISHDIYLKMYQLSNPVILFDVIYLDEAQDSNPVTLDVFLNQSHAQRIIVGDPFQAIYAWRGAVDAFSKVPASFTRLKLTESFRYTQDIADVAKGILSLHGCEENIIGKGDIANYKESNNERAIICRNNITILGYLLEAARDNKLVYTNVNLKDIFARVYHVSALMFGDTPKYPVAELKVYANYKELKKAAEKLPELRQIISVVQTLSATDTIYNSINKIKKILTDQPYEADFIISTAHKSKGLQWQEVTIAADMFVIPEEKTVEEFVQENPQELNLLYVAVSRSMYKLILPQHIKELLR
jgi:superfamily I DNA/RNA helicase